MPSMPAKFAGRKIINTVAVFSACVESDGAIAKVLTIRSSGDADLNAFYTDAILKWKAAPEQRRGKKVRSVLTVTVTLAIS
jgi:outer membrane biosynthesis protein TonB